MIYTVIHTGVHTWQQGKVLTDADLAGLDKQRLVDLGAILPTAEAQTHETPLLPLLQQNARHRSNQREKGYKLYPTRKRQANMKYRIMQYSIGQWEPGMVVSDQDLAGADMLGLLEAGAIAVEDEATPLSETTGPVSTALEQQRTVKAKKTEASRVKKLTLKKKV